MGDAATSTLADLLCNNSIIQELWLQGNNIGVRGATELSRALKHNTSLVKLSLLGCQHITFVGALALTESLHSNHNLRQLELPDEFQMACKRVTGYASIKTRLKWPADYTRMSIVNLRKNKVDCELLGESVIKFNQYIFLNLFAYIHSQELLIFLA